MMRSIWNGHLGLRRFESQRTFKRNRCANSDGVLPMQRFQIQGVLRCGSLAPFVQHIHLSQQSVADC